MIVLIIIVVAFVNKAKELGLNKALWGFIGAAAYFGTQFLFGIIAAFAMGLEEATSMDTSGELVINLIGIIIGGVAAYIAYQQMPNYVATERPSQDDLLDEDMFR